MTQLIFFEIQNNKTAAVTTAERLKPTFTDGGECAKCTHYMVA